MSCVQQTPAMSLLSRSLRLSRTVVLLRPMGGVSMPLHRAPEASRAFATSRWLAQQQSEGSANGEAASEQSQKAQPQDGANASSVESDTEKVVRLQEEVTHLTDRLQRSLAEMQNIRMIAQRDVEKARTYSTQSFSKAMLDVCDNLERAVSSVPPTLLETSPQEIRTLYDGIVMTHTQLVKVFKQNGIEQFGKVGDEFDPHRHEAMFQMPVPDAVPNSVAQVLSVGYMFKDRVLRPARVGTVKPPAE